MKSIPRDFKAGDPITADDLNAILAELRDPSVNITGEGMEITRGPRGQFAVTNVRGTGYICKAAAAIPARSGTAWGQGTVTLVGFDGTNDSTMVSTPIKVYNPSSTTMTSGNGIDSGMYCFAYPTEQGWWVVTPLECS